MTMTDQPAWLNLDAVISQHDRERIDAVRKVADEARTTIVDLVMWAGEQIEGIEANLSRVNLPTGVYEHVLATSGYGDLLAIFDAYGEMLCGAGEANREKRVAGWKKLEEVTGE